ncbi:hypothetical protein LAZ67_X002000 [Cordylochernes scorpioides]|uniref:Uncharacterized protein n=1 Tax=Cordylochernes scorpioides TaxID=51811 RepID=A0ABY6LW88_9ARAC|nr:hypothetical protein LAZ67_X002000 [Cordylochernes scorpioides]
MFSEGREDVNDEERAGHPSTSTTDEKINHRMNIANEMLDSVRDDPKMLQRVITGDEASLVQIRLEGAGRHVTSLCARIRDRGGRPMRNEERRSSLVQIRLEGAGEHVTSLCLRIRDRGGRPMRNEERRSCLHASPSQQQQYPLSWVCKAAALGLSQFSARLRPLLGMRI